MKRGMESRKRHTALLVAHYLLRTGLLNLAVACRRKEPPGET